MQKERKRVLTMLEDGVITAEEALALLEQLGDGGASAEGGARAEGGEADGHGSAGAAGGMMLRVRIRVIEVGNPRPTNVDVNLPLKLARVAGRLIGAMPQRAHDAMRGQGVDLSAIDWDSVIDDLAETGGDIVNITHEDEDEQVTVRVFIA